MTEHERPDARFSLANERTFLAWGRTCLALHATGVGVARLLPKAGALNVWFGVTLVAAGSLLAVMSFVHYRRADQAIRSDKPIPASRLPALLLGTIVLAGVFAFVLAADR